MRQEIVKASTPDRLAQKSYWLRRFKGELPRNALIPDRRSAGSQIRIAELNFRAEADAARRCWDFVTGSLLSAQILFIGVLAIVLRQHTREQEFLIACPVYRPGEPPEDAVAVPLRVAVSGESVFRDLLIEIRSQALQAYDNCAAPVAEALSQTDLPFIDGAPVYPVIAEVEGLHGHCSLNQFHSDLILRFSCRQETLEGKAIYRGDIYDESSMQCLVEHWIEALTAVMASDGLRVAEIAIAG